VSPQLAALLGGSALMVFVVEELSKNIQYLAGSRFRTWVNELARNRISAMLLGTGLSLLLSSSSVVTVMLVGLANAQLLSLEQVFFRSPWVLRSEALSSRRSSPLTSPSMP